MPAQVTQVITSLGTPPQTTDPTNFDARADALLATAPGGLPNMVGELNTHSTQINTVATEVNTNAVNAAAAAATAASGASIPLYTSGENVATGIIRRSTVSPFMPYTRVSPGGVSTTEPSTDTTFTNWLPYNPLSGNASAAINRLKGPDLASATTANIWTATQGNVMGVSGTTSTTGFTAAPQAGSSRTLIALAAWPLVNGANLILPGGVNYTCAVGDRLEVVAITTTQFRVDIFKKDGSPVTNTAGVVCLAVQSASTSATIDFTSLIDSTYDEYEIHFQNVVPSISSIFSLRTSVNAGVSFDAGASDYGYSSYGNTSATPTMSAQGNAAQTSIFLANLNVNTTAANGGISGKVTLIAPAGTASFKKMLFETEGANGAADHARFTGGGVRYTTAAVNAVRFLFASGNIVSGLFKLYGIRKTV